MNPQNELFWLISIYCITQTSYSHGPYRKDETTTTPKAETKSKSIQQPQIPQVPSFQNKPVENVKAPAYNYSSPDFEVPDDLRQGLLILEKISIE